MDNEPQDQILELGIKDFTDVIFDPTNPMDYTAMIAGPLGKGIMSMNKIQKLLRKLSKIHKQQRQANLDLHRNQRSSIEGTRSSSPEEVAGSQKAIQRYQKQLQKLNEQETTIKTQLPKGQLPLDLNRGGAVRLPYYGNPLMNLKY
tara:strand:+ start:598 stop:1035 length:438 start_codon:yes stop_codon:yes gene_type:complete